MGLLNYEDQVNTTRHGFQLHQCGVVTVANHGMQQDVIDRFFEQCRRLFALPLEEKMKILQDVNNRGYTPMGEETLDPATATQPDTKEGFYFGREIAKDSPESKKPLHGPNQWPDEELVPGFKKSLLEYFNGVRALAMRLLRLFALALQLRPDFFDDKFDKPITMLRPLHYSADKSRPENGVLGAGAHTDYGMLTILATDDVPGLQIMLSGKWTNVLPKQGNFIINIGDMLERWTNGMFKSTLHRVVNWTGQERYSIPFFIEPNFDCVVDVLPECLHGDAPKYPPITSGQYLLDKYALTHSLYKGPVNATESKVD